MEKYPDIGKTCLYDGIINEWFKKAGNLKLYNEIQNIASQYAKDKDAGLYTAILALDPERPFKSRGGKICKTAGDIANAIMAESAYYMDDLKRPNANLYLYLAATESQQGKEAADIFCKYFKEYSPKRALALVCLKLQSDGGITIGSKHYQSPEELKKEKNIAQIDLIKKAVTEKDSTLLVWLSDIYGDNLKSTDGFKNLSIPEQFFMLGLLPFLSYKEFNSNSLSALRSLIDTCPGRFDLFEIYAAQGLSLTGQNDDKKTPIDYAVCNFSKLSKKHGADTIRNMIRLLCKLGGDENQYRVYKERIEKQERLAEKEQQKRIAAQNCISASNNHTFGLKTDGTVVAVGLDNIGQCNTGSWRGIVAIAASDDYTVGLKADGTVVVVGKYSVYDDQKEEDEYFEVDVSGWRGIAAIAAGGTHTVGLKSDGTVVAVGKYCIWNEQKKEGEYFEVDVSGWRGIVAIAAGGTHTVGLKPDGTVVAVGDDEYGQSNTASWQDIAAIAAGNTHTVGLKTDGTVIAVGDNEDGQCNTGSWLDIFAVSAGGSYTVGLKSDGTVVAVGFNGCDQCNTGSWRDIGPFSEEKRIELEERERRTEQERIEQERRAEQERIEKQRRVEQMRIEGERLLVQREEQSKRWQEQGLCKYCGGKLGGLIKKKCKDCGREN